MDNTLLSLAILKVNWDHLKKDYIENFIPFIATLIDKNKYDEININKVCDDFKKEFGLIIPYHPMCTILNRARKKGLINKRGDRYLPNRDKIAKYDFSANANEQLRKHEKVTSEFIGFAEKTYNVTLNKEDADTALISFLKNHDIEILFAASQSTVLPPIKISNEKKFLIYSFIKYAHQSEPEIFRFIVDIAIGYILASTLLYSEFDKFKGKLSRIDFYFDTRCILRLLGVEGRERKEAYAEFILTLAEEGANLFIFRHTFEEITSILEDCLRWIESTRYDPSLASPVLKYFVQNNYKGSDVERLIVNVENILKDSKIQIVESPDPNKYQFYQIDEKKLYDNIIATYKEHNPSFPELEKSFIIQRDVKSIANVNKLRKGRHPKHIKEAGSIFVTTNSSLAFANKKFEQAEKSEGAIIPACLTDIFVGTLVWLQTPAKVLSLNEKKIVADCYAALQPSDLLIKKYLREIEKLKETGKINENEYYLLRTHRVALDLLEERTMGDSDSFTDKTSEEIIEEIRGKIKQESEERFIRERNRHAETLSELDVIKQERAVIKINISKRATQLSAILGWCVFAALFVLFLAGTVIQFIPKVLGEHNVIRIIIIIISLIIGFISVVTGFNIKGFRDKIVEYARNKIIGFLTEI